MRHIALIALLLALPACATLTADETQTIRISTTPEQGASCTISNGEQTWEVDSTPESITVPRAFKQLQVICSKEGVGSNVSKAQAGTRGRAYGNILLLGVPALVDAASGAGYEYPEEITVTLIPKP